LDVRRREFLAAAAASGAAIPLTMPLGVPAAWARSRTHVRLSSFDAIVKPFVAQMTLDEKLGQMTQGELNNIKDEGDIERYFLGSVLSGGDADPKEGNALLAWTDTVDRLIARSQRTRLRIPILYGVDAVHGHGNVEGAVVFPHNVGLGCTRNPDLIEEIGRISALEIRATGIQWTFAPCVAVPRDVRWGRTYEGFAERPELVRQLGAAAVRGLQSPDLSSPRAVLACAKHYIGDGGTTYQERKAGGRTLFLDQGDTQLSEAQLREMHLPGYVSAIEAGVGSIMVSYNSWNGARVSGVRRLLTEILKDELGFEGFLISDYYAIGQVDRDYKKAVAQSINAGMDMAMEPARYAVFIQTLKELVNDGTVPMSRIDDAVTRILRVKWAMGLMDPKRTQLADRKLHKSFGSARHRDCARQAVRESLVLLKNEKSLLPLSRKAKHIHLTGKAANDIGIQCGGWTVKWQGQAGKVTPGGTTILEAIEQSVSSKTKVTFTPNGGGAGGADVAIVVVGEMPYAEGVGDRSDLSLSAEDLAIVDGIATTGTPIVLVVISGRPLILGSALEKVSAVVAAWLPGTEGRGVSDVLFGNHAPSGKLSFSWPRSMDQLPVNENGPTAPLFPFGFGLTYS
jgi:beta-glucosidase